MDIDKRVELGTVVVEILVLGHEGAGNGIEGGCIPGGIPPHVRSDLHLHDIRPDDVELDEIPQVQRYERQWKDCLVRRILEKDPVVKVDEVFDDELLAERSLEHIDRRRGLADNAEGIIEDMACRQPVACGCCKAPSRYRNAAFSIHRIDLPEVVIPFEMVRVEMLLEIIRFSQPHIERALDRDRRVFVPAEGEEIEGDIGVQ